MERVLLTHCAPTLAGLKCANLVRLTGPRAELEAATQAWKATLAPRGVHVRTARWDGDSALLYLYREGHLRREWEKPGAADFLRRHGYDPGAAVEETVGRLLRRIARHPCFPHEIGLFLGYPWRTCRALSRTAAKTTASAAAGRSMGTRRPRCGASRGMKSARASTCSAIRMGILSRG